MFLRRIIWSFALATGAFIFPETTLAQTEQELDLGDQVTKLKAAAASDCAGWFRDEQACQEFQAARTEWDGAIMLASSGQEVGTATPQELAGVSAEDIRFRSASEAQRAHVMAALKRLELAAAYADTARRLKMQSAGTSVAILLLAGLGIANALRVRNMKKRYAPAAIASSLSSPRG